MVVKHSRRSRFVVPRPDDGPPPEPYRWDPPPTLRGPALHAADASGKHGLRHASWLELFYDLVFVSAIGGLSGLFHEGFSIVNLARFSALFAVVWWAWVGHTVYATRFATDDVMDRVLTLAVMLGALGMAVQIPFVTTGENGFVRGSDGFALAFVATRLPLLVMYARAFRGVPDARPLARLYLLALGTGVAFWALSVLTPPPLRFALWGVGLLAEFAVPWAGRRVLEDAPVDVSHLPERLGLFTIIVLGDSVLAVVGPNLHPLLFLGLLAGAFTALAIAQLRWWRVAPSSGTD